MSAPRARPAGAEAIPARIAPTASEASRAAWDESHDGDCDGDGDGDGGEELTSSSIVPPFSSRRARAAYLPILQGSIERTSAAMSLTLIGMEGEELEEGEGEGEERE